MKIYTLLIIALSLVLSSCVKQETQSQSQSSNSFESFTSKSYPITINVASGDTSYFEQDIVVDLSSGDFLIDNFSGIIGYRIEQVRFKIINFTGDQLTKCDFTFSYRNNTGMLGSPLLYSQVPLYDFSLQQNSLSITHSQATQTLVNQYMNTNKELIFRIAGNVDRQPTQFTANVYIGIKMSGK